MDSPGASNRAVTLDEFADVRDELGRRIDETRRDMFHGAVALFGSQVAVLAVLLTQS